MLKTKVAVVGSGPVGLFTSLLLQHFQIDFQNFQKFHVPRSHPSAHWVSGRSKQLLSQIPQLCQIIDQKQQSFEYFKYYRYCEKLLGFQFGVKNHFTPDIDTKLSLTKKMFGQYPSHINQDALLKILFNKVETKDRINFSQNIVKIDQQGTKNILINQKKQKICEADYVILANGVKSNLRDSLGINLKGNEELFNIINIHFTSKKLAELLKMDNKTAMLHFVYNNQMPSILVNHSYESGIFVLQIPNYQPFLDLTKVYTPRQLISTILDQVHWKDIQNDVDVVHIGKWKLQTLLADKFNYKNNIFLAGDTSHTFTPAGGFGMNCGFQDANQIVHFLHMCMRNSQANKENIFNLYDSQRKQIDMKYLNKSLQNYKITQNISKKVGFPQNLPQYYTNFAKIVPKGVLKLMPQSSDSLAQSVRLKLMNYLYKRDRFLPELQLFFDQFDQSVCKLSKLQNKIIQNTRNGQIKDLWLHQSVKLDEYQKTFGKIKSENIEIFTQQIGEKIIRRDGIVMK